MAFLHVYYFVSYRSVVHLDGIPLHSFPFQCARAHTHISRFVLLIVVLSHSLRLRQWYRCEMNRIVKINAGGRGFQTYMSTLLRFPDTGFAKLFDGKLPSPSTGNGTTDGNGDSSEVFLDVNPDVFERVLGFLRTQKLFLPTDNETLRADLVHHLNKWDLLPYAFPPAPVSLSSDATELVQLPDVCVVQLCDHMQHDQGVKRHAMTITYGADGFHLRELTKSIRRDLNGQLSSTYWQCYQTNERAAFFTTTKVANGAADLLTTSITQQVIAHTEAMGYHLTSSYVTLSPDIVHTSVRMLIHNFIFRRTRAAALEEADGFAMGEVEADEAEGELEVFQNFEPRPVGPQKAQWSESHPPPSERVTGKVFDD